MNSQRHVIKKQVLDLHISSDIEAFELQNKISFLYHSKIISLIESTCDRLSKSDRIQRIARLSIDIGEIDERSLETDFVERVAKYLSQELAKKLNSSTTNSSSLSIAASGNDNFDRQTISTSNTQKSRSTHLSALKSDSILSPTKSKSELLDYFLQTGRLPWWCKPTSKQALEDCCEQLLQTSPKALKALLRVRFKQIKILNRLIYQFSDRILLGIATMFVPDWSEWLGDYIQDLQTMTARVRSWQAITPQQFRLIIWQGIFLQLSLDSASSFSSEFVIQSSLCHIASSCRVDVRSLFTEIDRAVEQLRAEGSYFKSHLPNVVTAYLTTETSKKTNDFINNLLVDEQQENTLSASSQFIYSKQLKQSQSFESIARYTRSTYSTDTFSDSEEIYLQNSGLVLLCPFLNRFFNRLNLCQGKHFIDFDSTKRAVLILQYLVDKSCEIPEHLLPLNKLLCGLDIDEAIETQIYLSELEQQECDELLLAIIHQWSALKNTTTQGFIRGFIQRSGILKIHHGNWLLQVERKTYDVLLEKLPWNINAIKLPWMNTLLYINW